MKRIHKPAFFLLILLLLSVLVIIAAFFIFRNVIRENRFSDLLEKADNALLSHDYVKSKSLLKLSLTYAHSEKQYLRVLKRTFILAKKMEDVSVLKEFTLDTVEKKPGNEELIFIAAYACLKDGDSTRALELLEKPKLTDRLLALKIEALLLEGETENLTAYYTPSQPFRFLHLLDTDDPVFFEDAARMIEDRRLFLDTSLLYAHKGDIGKAFRIISSYEGDPLFYSPGVFIAYDAGEYTKADQFINMLLQENKTDNAVLFCLSGDVRMYSGEYDKAIFSYKKAIALDPLVSETAYLNISYIYQEQGDVQNALNWLKRGFKHFPRNRTIVLEASRLYIGLEKRETASSIIYSYTENKSPDFMINLMLLYLDQENINPVRYRTGLWDLFNAHPGNELLCRFLVLYLLGIEDSKGAKSALALFDIQREIGKNKQEYLPWVLHYKGICEIMTGDHQAALDFFASSLAREENPVVLFHRAVLYIELNNLKAAQDDLFTITTTNTISRIENKRFLSLVTATLGKVFILLREYSKAWEQLTRAREIDPENYKVLTLMKELEELQQ